MDDARTLPPLVRGKISGFLNLFLEEVRILNEILTLTRSNNIAVQIQWWGEIVPVIIRPQQIYLKNQESEKSSYQTSNSSVTYEIKTTFNLFKSYLQTCEVLELVIIKSQENFVLGSAFFRNLLNVIYKKNETATLPIVDFLGDVIGKIKVCATFLQNPLCEETNTLLRNNKHLTLKANERYKFSNDIDSKGSLNFDNVSSPSKVIVTNKHPNYFVSNNNSPDACEINNDQKDQDSKLEISSIKSNINQEPETLSLSENSHSGLKNKQCYCNDQKFETKQVPLPKSSFYIPQRYSQLTKNNSISGLLTYKSKKGEKLNPRKKGNSLVSCNKLGKQQECKTNKYAESTGKLRKSKDDLVKENVKAKKRVTDLTKEKEQSYVHEKYTSDKTNEKYCNCCFYSMPVNMSCTSENLVRNPSKMVLDFLFGKDMTKENEDRALKELSQMSPCQNFVETVSKASQGILQNSSHELILANYDKKKLTFNFDNPIERKYYDKFFAETTIQSSFHHDYNLSDRYNTKKTDQNSIAFPNHINQREDNVKNLKRSTFTYSNDADEQKVGNYPHIFKENTEIPRKDICCEYMKNFTDLDDIIRTLNNLGKRDISYEKKIRCKSS